MDVQVLHIADCPNWQEAGGLARRALDTLGLVEVPVDLVLITSREEAARRGFGGSPTFLVDGQDLFPSGASVTELACRIYPTERGLAGSPTIDQLIDALRARTSA
ncbi:hypothetical protein [Kribbia dieselivorans]|uniref:hypothetical protein n=1 Tax=Kribbia dieselivorans TaxID=331526 RepID=UPI0008385E6A